MIDIQGLRAGYGDLPVLRDIGFSVAPGEILLVIGENGAGKTTLMKTIGGLIAPSAGKIVLEGTDITRASPEDRAFKGLRLVLDGHRIFPEISVFDNLRLGGAVRRKDKQLIARAMEEIFSIFPILEEKRSAYARDLSGGQQQILALGQAFLAQPRVLLCDEPSAGLAQMLLPQILNFLRSWAKRGLAVVIVEQHVDIALSLADRVMFIERGAIKFICPASELKQRLREGVSA